MEKKRSTDVNVSKYRRFKTLKQNEPFFALYRMPDHFIAILR